MRTHSPETSKGNPLLRVLLSALGLLHFSFLFHGESTRAQQ